jgi:hypothetical protein
MPRPKPRKLYLGLVLLGTATALFAATSATGHSQTAPQNTKEPFIAAPFLITAGVTLQGNIGTWTGTEPIKYTYQWKRCNDNGDNCKDISAANNLKYKVTHADEGFTLRFQVGGKNADGKDLAESNATATIPHSPNAPLEASSPAVSGSAIVGQQLTATPGTWKGTQPITTTIRWQRCNADETGCANNGTQGATYTVVKADVGKILRVKVLAQNSVGDSTALSTPTPVVKDTSGGGGGGGGGNVVQVKDVGPAGERLVVDNVTFNPNPVTTRNVPINVTITVKDTKGHLVQGALVFIRSTPIVSSTPTDAPTGANGQVSYSIQPRSDFPIKNGYSVQFFVKAYRSGDPTLAGISGTRLVQVATHKP